MQSNYSLFGQYQQQQQPILSQMRFQPAQTPSNPYTCVSPQPLISANSHQKLNRAMYTSTIQTPSYAQSEDNGMGLSALMGMCRFVKEQSAQPKLVGEENIGQNSGRKEPLQFRRNGLQKGKMSASVIFPKSNDENASCSSFLQISQSNPVSQTSSFHMARLQPCKEPKDDTKTRSQDLKQKLLSMQNQMNELTKKIETSKGMKLQDKDGKVYFQLPTRKINQVLKSNDQMGNMAVIQLNQYANTTEYSQKSTIQKDKSIFVPLEGMFKKKNVIGDTENSTKLANFIPIKNLLSLPNNNKIMTSPSQKQYTQLARFTQTGDIYGQRSFSKSDFIIGKKMGKGQFGEVMLCQHKKTGFICGMKIMSKKQIKAQKYVNQIARELSIQFYLAHRNIAPLYGYFSDEQNIYLLVQFCAQGQLLEKLRKNRRMEQEETSPIIREIVEGLDYVHREMIIHRDIKPQNILFNFGTVKISDFGWAVYADNNLRRTVSGSPLYYSPEVVMETAYDEKVDVWAVGMMTYECLLGKIPFKIYSEFDLNRIVSDEITFPEYVDVTNEAKDFILRIMKKKPQERMSLRDMLRHPFITNYRDQKVSREAKQDMRKLLS